jgi:hypothetical protein
MMKILNELIKRNILYFLTYLLFIIVITIITSYLLSADDCANGIYPDLIKNFGSESDNQFIADVDGDGYDDAICFINGKDPEGGQWFVSFYDSATCSFQLPMLWCKGHGYNSNKQFVADVDGDKKADAVVFFDGSNPNGGNWYTAISKGREEIFYNSEPWSAGHGYMSDNQFVADVTGDGKADAIVFFNGINPNGGNWYVATSNGIKCNNYTQWSTGHGYGSNRQFIADVDNDKLADAIVYFDTTQPNGDKWYVAISKADRFDNYIPWGNGSEYRSDNQLVADVDNDGTAEAILFLQKTGSWYVSNLIDPASKQFNGFHLWGKGFGKYASKILVGNYNGKGNKPVVFFSLGGYWLYGFNGNWRNYSLTQETLGKDRNLIIFDDDQPCVGDLDSLFKNYILVEEEIPSNDLAYTVSDEKRFARKTWDEPAYATQGSLILGKLMSFGSEGDIKTVKKQIMATPVESDGRVHSTEGQKWHLGGAGSFDANFEFIIMARDYLAHTGDKEIFNLIPNRIVCYQPADGIGTYKLLNGKNEEQNCLCNRSTTQIETNEEASYVESIKPFVDTGHFEFLTYIPGLRNPARALGQLIKIDDPFLSLKMPVVFKIHNDNNSSRSYTIYVVNNDTMRTVKTQQYIVGFNENAVPCWMDCFFSEPNIEEIGENNVNRWLEINFDGPQPPGVYNIEMHSTNHNPSNEDYWYSPFWIGLLESHENCAATVKHYYNDPFTYGAEILTLKNKLERAMSWALSGAQRSGGNYGLFIIKNAKFRGTDEFGNWSSSYYDLFKSGYKDSYVNLRFIESLYAYKELLSAGVVTNPSAVSIDTIIQSVKNDFLQQLVRRDNTGSINSWIGCSMIDNGLTQCNDSAVDLSNQHPYYLDLVYVQALAARLFPEEINIQRKFVEMRNQSRMAPGIFRTNLIPVEQVEPRIWTASDEWGNWTTDGFAVFDINEGGDWQIFKEPFIGYGNYGNQEENGGTLLSTTSFIFQAGIYPEMLSDIYGLSQSLTAIGKYIQTENEAGLVANIKYPYIRKRVTDDTDDIVRYLCEKRRDDWDDKDKICAYYKSVSLSLPENGYFINGFLTGLLDLHITATGDMTIYGTKVNYSVNNSFEIVIPEKVLNDWPDSLNHLYITGFRVFGKKINMICRKIENFLECTVYSI